ncbi:hypothetical protein OAJ45_01995 [Candidatus Poseidoniales archaeon]|nr:hypothetical protein [Candidatus Poseidoniales archaeon]
MPSHLTNGREQMYRLPNDERATIQANQDALFRELTVQQRQEMFQEVGQIYMDQRNRLLRFRNYTGQAAAADSGSLMSELFAAIVVGNPGWCRKGKDHGIDLVAHQEMVGLFGQEAYAMAGNITNNGQGTLINPDRPSVQVKRGYRLDPMIDFRLTGRVSEDGNAVIISEFPPNFTARDLALVNYHRHDRHYNIQPLKRLGDERLIADAPIWRLETSGNTPLAYDAENGVWKLNLRNEHNANIEPYSDGEEFVFDLKGERGKIDFGSETPGSLRALLRTQPVIVHSHHDRRARPVVSVFICSPTEAQMTAMINGILAFGYCNNGNCQYRRVTLGGVGFDNRPDQCPNPDCQRENVAKHQPYLFYPDDSARDQLNQTVKSYHNLGARLVAHGHLDRDGFVVDLFDPEGGWEMGPDSLGEQMLLRLADEEDCSDMTILPLDPDERTPEAFARNCIVEFYRSMIPYLDTANMSRQVIGDKLSEHLQTLFVDGGMGTGSAAKGLDVVNMDTMPQINPLNPLNTDEVDELLRGAEVKQSTGERGDEMGVEDRYTRMNFPRKITVENPIGCEHMQEWTDLLPTRIMHEVVDGNERLAIACFRLPEGGIEAFRTQAENYFTQEFPNSTNLQYHAQPFDQNFFGLGNHNLDFVRTFEYVEYF